MSQEILNFCKFIKSKPSSKVYTLLCSASFLILWMMAFSGSAIAQINSSSTNQLETAVQPWSKDNIEDLENSFIEQMTTRGVSPGKKSPVARTNELTNPSRNRLSRSLGLPVLRAQDVSQLTAELSSELIKDSPSCNIADYCQQTKQINQAKAGVLTFNQLLNPLPQEQSADTQNVQEFTVPGIANSGLNHQTYIAPLPPLPGTQTQPAPDRDLNSQLTFNQLLYSSKNQTEVGVTPRLNNNPLLNSPTIQPTATKKYQSFSQGPQLSAPLTQRNTVQGSRQPSVVAESVEQQPPRQNSTAVIRKPLKEPSLTLQGVYVNQDGDTSARARVTGIYPLTPQALFGATLDFTNEDNSFDDSRGEGLNINELYLATSLGGLPNLRFIVGQMDLTSYFDRNSFAKDGASHFFNPVFQTNPALSSTGIASHPGLLVNWSVTDNIAAKAAIFSSSNALSDFSLDGFAGEIGIRHGNAIIRGTYSTARDAGNRDSFLESFGIARGNNQFGPLEDDREEAYGLNAEVFIPKMKLGLFGRYGRYENRDLGEGGETYSLGLSFLDLLTPDDRLGLAYGRALSNDALRQGEQPDVVEVFYDFKFLPNLRFGLSFQGRDSFEESVLGIRVKSELDITPKRRNAR